MQGRQTHTLELLNPADDSPGGFGKLTLTTIHESQADRDEREAKEAEELAARKAELEKLRARMPTPPDLAVALTWLLCL